MREVQVALAGGGQQACPKSLVSVVGSLQGDLFFFSRRDETETASLTRKTVRPADFPAPVEATSSAGDCFPHNSLLVSSLSPLRKVNHLRSTHLIVNQPRGHVPDRSVPRERVAHFELDFRRA